MKSIAVFFGGQTVEHDISVITGVLTLNTIDKEKFNPIPVYIDNDGTWYSGEQLFDLDSYANINYKRLRKVSLIAGDNVLYSLSKSKLKAISPIAVAINCMHGERGEDGALAGLLKMCKIPLASPEIMPSSISIDKSFTKTALKGIGVKTVPCIELSSSAELEKIHAKIQYPVIVKPNTSGSSVGISKANDNNQLFTAVSLARRYSQKVIIEKYMQGAIEINCGAYKGIDGEIVVSECERPFTKSDILTFSDKYENGSREFPAKIEVSISKRIKEITKKVYEKLSFNGIIRIDYFVLGQDVYLNEINSVPGSLAYYLFCPTLKEFSKILTDIITSSEREFASCESLVKKFPTSILTAHGSKSSKRL